MPAYSFKERFCSFVIDGSKPHTVRARRKNHAKKGDILYLYFGMRTKWCKKLRQEICTNAVSLSISEGQGVVMYDKLLSEVELETAKSFPLSPVLQDYNPHVLSDEECDAFAWMDGFRAEGSTLQNPKGSFEIMRSYWRKEAGEFWSGDIVFWNPNGKNETVYTYIKQLSGYN